MGDFLKELKAPPKLEAAHFRHIGDEHLAAELYAQYQVLESRRDTMFSTLGFFLLLFVAYLFSSTVKGIVHGYAVVTLPMLFFAGWLWITSGEIDQRIRRMTNMLNAFDEKKG